MKKKFVWPILLFLTVLLMGSEIVSYHQLAYAKSASHGEQAGHGNEGGHGDSHGGHHPSPPVIYYIYWIILLIALIRSVQFLKVHQDEAKAHKLAEITVADGIQSDDHDVEHEAHEKPGAHDEHGGGHDDHGHHPEPTMLDKFLVLCVVVMFIFEQVPSLAHFHEANSLGVIKFLIKFGLGVSLMTYGILGMGEH